MTLAVLFNRLGPYHHARLSALARQGELTAIEFTTVDNTYAWDLITGKHNYHVIQVFTDADIDTKPVSAIIKNIRNALSNASPKVVAIPGWSSTAALAALEWCCITRTPAILMSDSTAHDEPRIWWKEWIKSRVVRLFSTALVAGAPHVDYITALGLPRKRVFTGYDVVDNDYFFTQSNNVRAVAPTLRLRHGLPENYFLASNRFIEKKNLPRLLDAYAGYVAQVGAGAWSLVLLGDGPQKKRLLDQVARLGLAGKVLFPGFKQYHELPVFYGLASAFIHASTTEQWGLVVNEAMASGLPVLVSDQCGCAADLIHNGVNGFTFNPFDTCSLTKLMLKMGGAECDLVSMGQASRNIIRNQSPQEFAIGMKKAGELALADQAKRPCLLTRLLLLQLIYRKCYN